MPQINTYALPQFTDLVKRSFTKALEELPLNLTRSDIIVKNVVPHGTGDVRRFAERLQRNQYASNRPEGDISTQARVQYGWEKDMTIYTVSLEVSITKRMRDAGKEQAMLDQVTDLSEVCPNRKELDISHRYSFAWSTSYVNLDGITVDVTMGDSKAMIATDHALTGSATTYSTQITANPQFSKGALEIAEQSFVENSYNNLGEKVTMNPDTILTTDDPNTIHQVQELLRATADVSTSNSGTYNVYGNARYKHIVWPRIATTATGATDTTKRKYWFLIDTGMSDFYVCTLNEAYLKTPMDGNNGEQFSSENWNYMAASDYGMAQVSAKNTRWSKGDGSA